LVDPNRDSHQLTTPYSPEAGTRSVILAPKGRLSSAHLVLPTGRKAQYLDSYRLQYTRSCGGEDKAKGLFNALSIASKTL
jgi:hypothetical protein